MKNMNLSCLVLATALVSQVSCTRPKAASDLPPTPHGDVIVRVASEPVLLQPRRSITETDLSACRANIEQLVCWVEPQDSINKTPWERPCLAGSEKFVPYFQGHFDRSPPFIQKMYCHLEKIWVEKNYIATAYASPRIDSRGRVVSASIGIRDEVLGSPLKLDEWLSWKEETSFGGGKKTSDPRLGIISYHSNQSTPEFFLDYVLNHEFGHLLDFSNQLNATTQCDYEKDADGKWQKTGTCEPLPGTWGEISWLDDSTPKAEDNFPLRDSICFYFCNGKFLAQQNAPVLFEGLFSSRFPSIYASQSPNEDFAEALALHLAHDIFGFRYRVEALGKNFNLTEHYYSAKIESKRNYVKSFLARPFLYPGEE